VNDQLAFYVPDALQRCAVARSQFEAAQRRCYYRLVNWVESGCPDETRPLLIASARDAQLAEETWERTLEALSGRE